MNAFISLRRASRFLPLLAVLACKKSSDLEPALVGEADMRRYVAVGDAFTAGVSNGGLYRVGQLASYPNLLAQQFALSGGSGNFVQPLFSEAEENGSGYLRLTAVSPLTLAPVTEKLAVRGSNPTLYTKFEGDNQNLGVPNLRLTDVFTPGYGAPTGNPYFERLLPGGQEQKTYAQYVSDSKPTFFTYWLGNTDLLAFVSSGGTRLLPETGTFTASTKQLFDALAAAGAKGAVANLPDPTGFPLLMRPNALAALRQDRYLPYWITTADGDVRPATEDDLILMNADSIGALNRVGFPKGFFQVSPLNDDDVLDKAEITRVRQATESFNAALSAQASAHAWPVVDMNGLFKKTQSGYLDFFGNPVRGDLLENGQLSVNTIFSVDAIHPNARGYAFLANEFIDVINQAYNAQIPRLNISQFSGLKLTP